MLSFDRENASLLCQFCGIAGKPHKSREDCIDALRNEIALIQFNRAARARRHALRDAAEASHDTRLSDLTAGATP
jgi:hypothetical protein